VEAVGLPWLEMIQRPTAFIFGAGASIPYGFPSGEGLLNMARVFDSMNLRSKVCAPAMEDQTENLRLALNRTHDSSLDLLLELRPDITEIGKRLIASLLLELEFHSPHRFPTPDADWLTLFFGELVAETTCLEDFAKNPVSLITYNYDRLLEYRLTGALMAHYGRPEADCIATLAKISIIHLHGDLGQLPGFSSGETVPFGPSPADGAAFPRYIDHASKRIVIVHEARGETPEFDRARKILQSVSQIVMVGFGYGAKNLSRLEIGRWRNAKNVMGTTYGLTAIQTYYSIARPFQAASINVQQADPRFGAREFFANNLGIFREPP
jgi:hypothetical protein